VNFDHATQGRRRLDDELIGWYKLAILGLYSSSEDLISGAKVAFVG
jgi:hypothetical protein